MSESPSKVKAKAEIAGPVSAAKDIVDPIYKNDDPIFTSIGYR